MRVIIAFKHSWNKDINVFEKIKNKLIQWWTNSRYFHVEICIDNTWITSCPDKGGVIKKRLRTNKGSNWDYFEIKVHELTPIQQLILCDFINKQIGTGYDWLGIYSRVFTIFRDDRTKWFCSEICTKLLQLMYVKEVLDYEPYQVTPGLLYNLLKKILIPLKEITFVKYEVDHKELKL